MGDASPLQLKTLVTPRLALAPLVVAHAEAMFDVLSDPAIYEFENAPPASVDSLRARYGMLETRRSADGREVWLNWVALLLPERHPIGYVQATVLEERRALIAYEFGSAWWGRGLACEGVAAMVEHLGAAFDVVTVGAVFKRANHRSRNLLQRLGMAPSAAGEFPRTMCKNDEDAMVLRVARAG